MTLEMESAQDARIRIAILDGQRIVREGLRMLIETQKDLEVSAEIGMSAEALKTIHQIQPDIILLDLDLGEVNIIDHIPEIQAASKDSKILALTGINDPEIHHRVLRNGAKGIVLKEETGGVVLKAIRKVYGGEAWIDHATTARILIEISPSHHSNNIDPEAEKIALLTHREREIIEVLGEGLNNKQIGEKLFISEATARNHLTSILSKLGLSDRFELAIYSYRHGLAKLPVSPTTH
jgi:two-component system, NarL family, nitrate/nitrite response regulator NarL